MYMHYRYHQSKLYNVHVVLVCTCIYYCFEVERNVEVRTIKMPVFLKPFSLSKNYEVFTTEHTEAGHHLLTMYMAFRW